MLRVELISGHCWHKSGLQVTLVSFQIGEGNGGGGGEVIPMKVSPVVWACIFQ